MRINFRIAAHDNEYADARENLEDSLGLLAHVSDIYQRCDDLNRRLCDQALFTAIYIDEDGQPSVTYHRPYTLCATPRSRETPLPGLPRQRKGARFKPEPDWSLLSRV